MGSGLVNVEFPLIGKGCHNAPIRLMVGKQTDPEDVVLEVTVLERCRGHPYFVQLLDVVFQSDKPLLVMERFGVELTNFLKASPFEGYGPHQLRVSAFEVFSGIAHLSSLGILHGDIKPPNVLAELRGTLLHVKLADLGNACLVINGTSRHPHHHIMVPRVRSNCTCGCMRAYVRVREHLEHLASILHGGSEPGCTHGANEQVHVQHSYPPKFHPPTHPCKCTMLVRTYAPLTL